MASYAQKPTLDLQAGRAVLEADLPKVLRLREAQSLDALGWRQEGLRRLFIPLSGTYGGVKDNFLLRLEFKTGRDWPPSAQFVDPDSLDYRGKEDQHHLPMIRGQEVHTHVAYQNPPHCVQPIQLICCSATYEYYESLHGGEERLCWQPTDTFLLTLSAIERGMSQHYSGRFARHDG